MHPISKYIRSRRSIYPPAYKEQAIEKEVLLEILENANHAPTHRKTEPWRFVLFHSAEAREKLADYIATQYAESTPPEKFSAMKQKKKRQKALKSACVIALCYQRDSQERVPEIEEIEATACAVQNIWLTASALGIGAYWSSPKYMYEANDFLELSEGQHCVGLFYMGYADPSTSEADRSPIEEKIRWL